MVFRNSEYKALCKLLVAARSDARLSQRGLAEALGRQPSVIASIELGDRRVDVIEFIDIAKALRIDPGKLFSRLLKELEIR